MRLSEPLRNREDWQAKVVTVVQHGAQVGAVDGSQFVNHEYEPVSSYPSAVNEPLVERKRILARSSVGRAEIDPPNGEPIRDWKAVETTPGGERGVEVLPHDHFGSRTVSPVRVHVYPGREPAGCEVFLGALDLGLKLSNIESILRYMRPTVCQDLPAKIHQAAEFRVARLPNAAPAADDRDRRDRPFFLKDGPLHRPVGRMAVVNNEAHEAPTDPERRMPEPTSHARRDYRVPWTNACDYSPGYLRHSSVRGRPTDRLCGVRVTVEVGHDGLEPCSTTLNDARFRRAGPHQQGPRVAFTGKCAVLQACGQVRRGEQGEGEARSQVNHCPVPTVSAAGRGASPQRHERRGLKKRGRSQTSMPGDCGMVTKESSLTVTTLLASANPHKRNGSD